MVKPQFEVGKERLGKGGVVRDPDAPRRGRVAVAESAGAAGLGRPRGDDQPAAGPVGERRVLPLAPARRAVVDADDVAAEVARTADPGGAG